MPTPTDETLELATQPLRLLNALASAAEDLAGRARDPALKAAERAALRNQAKLANEQAGMLLARGAVVLFNGPPGDAARQIDEAIAGTQQALEKIRRIRKALEFVTTLVGVAGALLAGDWKGVARSLEAVRKKLADAKA